MNESILENLKESWSLPFKQFVRQQRINLFGFGLFVILTIIAAWPIVRDLDGVLIGKDNDVFINPWADWWTGKAISDPDITLWQTEYLFYPNGANLVYHSFSHLNSLVSLGLRPLVGPVPAYNLTMLINLVLNGFSMFQLARYLSKSTLAAILAGIVFAFNSQITYQSAHPVLFSVWCLPWSALYLLRAVRENSYRLAFFAGIIVFLGAATSLLMFVINGILLGLLVVFLFLSNKSPKPKILILTTFSFVCLVLIIPIIFPVVSDAITQRNSSFIIDSEESLQTDIFSIFIPDWFIEIKRRMYLGIIPFYLFLVATRQIGKGGKFWFILLVTSFLFAIGPDPAFLGTEINVVLPWSLLITPVLRNTYRMMLLFAMAWAMVAAYGWIQMKSTLNYSSNKVVLIGFIIALVIYGEYTIKPYPHTDINVSSFYLDYLDDVPDEVALAILPIGRQEDKRYLLYQTFHHHPITGGVISRAEEDTFEYINSNQLLRAGAVDWELTPIPTNIAESFNQLIEINVGFLILDKTLLDNEEEWRAAISFTPVYEDELLLVYETGLNWSD